MIVKGQPVVWLDWHDASRHHRIDNRPAPSVEHASRFPYHNLFRATLMLASSARNRDIKPIVYSFILHHAMF